jgi:hypothetical protein
MRKNKKARKTIFPLMIKTQILFSLMRINFLGMSGLRIAEKKYYHLLSSP